MTFRLIKMNVNMMKSLASSALWITESGVDITWDQEARSALGLVEPFRGPLWTNCTSRNLGGSSKGFSCVTVPSGPVWILSGGM